MTYDAGHYVFTDTRQSGESGVFNPIEAYKAYKAIFKGTINIGLEAPAEAWGGNVLNSNHIKNVADAVKGDSKDGLFMWSIQKASTDTMSTT